MLGTAAGTTARQYARYFPDTQIDAVEIDGALLDIGRRYFDLEDRPQLHKIAEDARPFLRRSKERYDVIMVDAYRQPYIPFYLTTKEFFELARERLTPGGVVAINVGHPEGSDRLEKVLTATLHSAFRNVARDPLNDTNTILMGSDAPVTGAKLLDASRSLAPDLRPVAVRAAARLRPGLSGGTVYTDDHAPVEWLVDESLIQYAEKGG
jgi:predicted O-methyltransferase YrrM